MGLPPTLVGVEIPEKQIIEHLHSCRSQFEALREAGLTVTVDNFSGNLSLNHLQKLPIDFIKLDRTTVASINSAPKRQSFIAALIVMAHSLNIEVIAGCVETAEEYAILHELGCDEFQGFFFSQPLRPEALLEQWQQERTLTGQDSGHVAPTGQTQLS